MRKELIVKSKSLGGVSDLTLLAPLKKGLVPALDAVTYKTRVKRLLKTLSIGRATSHEYALLRPFSDAVERVGKIHSVRVAVVEPDKVLLAVTFDGTWESYLRVLWQKVGTLLDVIFCNTEGYPSAYDHSFEEWANWVRSVQIETDFFYGIPRLTVDDVQYLRQEEQLHRIEPGAVPADLSAVRATVRSAEQQAWEMARRMSPAAIAETVRLALQSLSVVHRLTSMYLPSEDDGKYLHRAARDLLLEFIRLKDNTLLIDQLVEEGRQRFDEPLAWLLRPPAPGRAHASSAQAGIPAEVRADLQAGIVSELPRNTVGGLLFFAFDDGAAMDSFLGALHLASDADQPSSADEPPPDEIFCSVSITVEGLRKAGLREDELAWFPMEFREGMEARCSLLGDLWYNHPRRWKPPLGLGESFRRIELCSVHAVVQLRSNDKHAVEGEIDRLASLPGATLLAVEPMARRYEGASVKEHFGFVDGMSNPSFDPAAEGDVYDNRVPLGEVLLGHPNQADPAPGADWSSEQRGLLQNGSFLVVRKLRQDVPALNAMVTRALDGPLGGRHLGVEELLGKMMGRMRDGTPLVDRHVADSLSNDFDFAADPEGTRCPFHAHIRRANPRSLADPEIPLPPGGRFPRLLRRGMSYGPRHEGDPKDEQERGLMFMAYNASIAEQFEVVQRWLAGGNSSGGYSGQGDPFLGVAPIGQPRHYRFEHKKAVCTMALDGAGTALTPFRPLVRLEWGAYLFVPSLSALAQLRDRAACADAAVPVWSEARGLCQLEALEAMDASVPQADQVAAWKAVLEDPDAQERFVSADIWAAIRAHRDGIVRTPYGVIVADADLVKEVLARSGQAFSVSGYQKRMRGSIGEIYLGLDDTGAAGCPYRQQSEVPNKAISGISEHSAFNEAQELVSAKLAAMVKKEKFIADSIGQGSWELNLNLKELIDPLIEGLCVAWFGVPTEETVEFTAGPARWDWTAAQPPRCPGHFTAPSRFFFQPQPGKTVQAYGQSYGKSLTRAMKKLVLRWRKAYDGKPIAPLSNAPVGRAIFGMQVDGQPADADLVARTMVGAMMGFIPTLDGALRLVLNEWLRDGSFWALRDRWQLAMGASANSGGSSGRLEAAATAATRSALVKAMQLRPMPELVWRTVSEDCHLGSMALHRGDKVVLSIASAMQQALADGSEDVMAMFGGDRQAAPHSHACPGHAAAIGAMLGAVTALLRSKELMRPSPAPMAFTVLSPPADLPALPAPPDAAPSPAPAPTASTAGHRTRSFSVRSDVGDESDKDESSAAEKETDPPRPMLLAEGDSWFDHWSLPGQSSLLKPLRELHGYDVEEVASAGDTLQAISRPAQVDELAQRMRRLRGRGVRPHAILLSVGGNDIVAPIGRGPRPELPVLVGLLNVNDGKNPYPLNADAARNYVTQYLEPLLRRLLHRIDAERRKYFDPPPPVVLHGYDFPVPDGRGSLGSLGNWLAPCFSAMKWNDEHRSLNFDAMRQLIGMLNEMLAGLAAELPNVIHAKLTGTLATDSHHERDWENELHPTSFGYEKLAARLHAEYLSAL